MTSNNQSTYEVLCELLQPFNSAGVALQPTTDISTDLNIDSVSVMDFVMEVEDRFDIDIPLNVLSETRTLSDLVAVVEGKGGKGK
jgi:acyl carrier protein